MYKSRLLLLPILLCLFACGSGPTQPKSASTAAPDNATTSAVPSPEHSKTGEIFSPEYFKTTAEFELVNHQSSLIQQGSSRLITKSGIVNYREGLMPGKVAGLEIQFFTRPLTEADRNDVVENDAKNMRTTDYASLVLYLEKETRMIGQVNLTYVVPGTTVTRTVAGSPDAIKKYFSDYQYDGERLQLKSKGTFNETDEKQQSLSLAWNVDVDLPVFADHRQ